MPLVRADNRADGSEGGGGGTPHSFTGATAGGAAASRVGDTTATRGVGIVAERNDSAPSTANAGGDATVDSASGDTTAGASGILPPGRRGRDLGCTEDADGAAALDTVSDKPVAVVEGAGLRHAGRAAATAAGAAALRDGGLSGSDPHKAPSCEGGSCCVDGTPLGT